MTKWPAVDFLDVVSTITPATKVKRSAFLPAGSFPVISQEAEQINGWWDKADDVVNIDGPVVIFGDHTRVVKYVDEPFVVGADGVKILQPNEKLLPRFLFYWLSGNVPESLGYARHFRLFAKSTIPLPPLDEQKRIVAKLDEVMTQVSAGLSLLDGELGHLKELGRFSIRDEPGRALRSGSSVELRPLADVVDFRRGLTYSKGDEVDFSGKVVLRANNVDLYSGRLDLSELKYLREDFDVPADRMVRRGSVLMCISSGSKAHVGKTAYIDSELSMAFGGFMGLLVPRSILLPEYLYWVTRSEEFARHLQAVSPGASINNLKFRDIANFQVPVPDFATQSAVCSALSERFDCVSQLDQVLLEKKRLLLGFEPVVVLEVLGGAA